MLPADAWRNMETQLEEAHGEIKTTELAFLTDLLKRGVASNAFSFSEPSASISECLFDLSDALKHDVAYKARRMQTKETDFSAAVERMEHVLKLILDRR